MRVNALVGLCCQCFVRNRSEQVRCPAYSFPGFPALFLFFVGWDQQQYCCRGRTSLFYATNIEFSPNLGGT